MRKADANRIDIACKFLTGDEMPIRLADHTSNTHSQHGEDGVIAAIFHEIGTKSKTCVEFGAFDLRIASNVYPLWTTGWKTLLIEGNAKRYRKLVADYAAYPGSADLHLSIANKYVDADGPNSLDNILSEFNFTCGYSTWSSSMSTEWISTSGGDANAFSHGRDRRVQLYDTVPYRNCRSSYRKK